MSEGNYPTELFGKKLPKKHLPSFIVMKKLQKYFVYN